MHTAACLSAFLRRPFRLSGHAFLVPLMLGVATGAIGVRAQSPRPMGLVDLLDIPRLGDPQLSPDGRDVVFTRSESDWKSGRRVTHIWRATVGAAGDPIQLTN